MTKNIDPHIFKQFKIGELMGSGAYGHVWKVESKVNGKRYALKKVFGAFRNNVDAQRTYRQVQILKQVKHKNIIKLQKVIGANNKEDLYLLFELMQADLLSVVGSKILSINHQKYLLFQLVSSISYLHELKLIHRDLKPSNALLDSNCLLKICDFGLVRSLNTVEPDNNILSEEVATKWYRAPQLLLGSRSYSFPIDLWSIGCIAAQLLTGKTLFSGSSTLEQLQKILQYSGLITQQDLQSLDSPIAQCLISQIHPKKRLFSDYFSLVDPIFYPLLKSTLKFNPNKRLSAKKCLQLQIFKQFVHEIKDTQVQSIQKPVSLSLDDNKRYNAKDYRSHIYDCILKSQSFKNNNQSNVSKNKKYKSITISKSPSNHTQNRLKSPNDQKAKSSSYLIKQRFNVFSSDNKSKESPFKKRQIRQRQLLSPTSKSVSKGKNGNPYQKSAKQLALLLKNKQRLPINTKTQKYQSSKLKKVSKIVRYDKNYKK